MLIIGHRDGLISSLMQTTLIPSVDVTLQETFGEIEMYEEEILKELREMNNRLANLEELFLKDIGYGGSNFRGCLMRIMYGVEE